MLRILTVDSYFVDREIYDMAIKQSMNGDNLWLIKEIIMRFLV